MHPMCSPEAVVVLVLLAVLAAVLAWRYYQRAGS
jgi:hypothetical protein